MIFCDSHNEPLARLHCADDVEAAADRYVEAKIKCTRQYFSQHSEWKHRTPNDVEAAIENGVQEWWKGSLKSSLFWKHKPKSLVRQLAIQQFNDVKSYIDILVRALALISGDEANKVTSQGATCAP